MNTAPHLRWLSIGLGLVVVGIGCGGPPSGPDAPAAPPDATRPPPPPADVWPPVLAGTAAWQLEGHGGAVLRVEAHEGRHLGTGEVVRLRWSIGGSPYLGAPTQVAVDANVVHLLDASLEDADVLDALEATSPWPRRAIPLPSQTRLDGLYAHVWQSSGPNAETVVCYGEGPPTDAPPCEDVCFGELCIAERGGIVELSGRWAPDADVFSAPAYRGFQERFTFVRGAVAQP